MYLSNQCPVSALPELGRTKTVNKERASRKAKESWTINQQRLATKHYSGHAALQQELKLGFCLYNNGSRLLRVFSDMKFADIEYYMATLGRQSALPFDVGYRLLIFYLLAVIQSAARR